MRLLATFAALSLMPALRAAEPARPMSGPAVSGDWAAKESRHLRNVRQITFGAEKTGEAYFNRDGTKIIFQRVPEGKQHYQMYVLDLTQPKAEPRMVSTGKGACTCGYFRPDGKKIIFASNHEDPDVVAGRTDPEEKVPGYQRAGSRYSWAFPKYMNIYEADLDGSNLRALTKGPFYSAEGNYSPDGKQIVFGSNREGNMEIYVMDADGNNVRRVTHARGYDGGPFFSPDGKKIIFRGDPRNNDKLQVFTINVDGTGEKAITDNDSVNWGPIHHPDGKRIIFASSLGSAPGKHTYDLWMVDEDGDMLERITWHPGPDILPVFSPDGKNLMWTARRGEDNKTQIFIADWID